MIYQSALKFKFRIEAPFPDYHLLARYTFHVHSLIIEET